MRAQKIRNAGLLLGIGLGGFLDRIVLHQILQWRTTMAAEGWFQLATWLVTLAGVIVLWSALRGPGPLPRGRSLAGWALIGWGAFNLVEGAVNYDWVFLLVGGAGVVVLGYLVKAPKEEAFLERRSGFDRRSASPLR